MKEWKQRFMSMYLCLYVCVCGGYKSKSGDIRRILMGVGGGVYVSEGSLFALFIAGRGK